MFDLVPFARRNRGMSMMERQLQEMNDMFNNFWKNNSSMRCDVRDEGDHYLMKGDLPGFEKDDIHIDIKDDVLTISAERSSESESSDDSDEQYVYRERSYGSFRRSFDVSNIKQDEISARYRQGVLELTLPKKEEQKKDEGRRLEIED